MCTVVIRVPEKPDDAVQVLAVRDEDPARGWDPLGESWPEHPGIIGVRISARAAHGSRQNPVRAGSRWF